MRAIVCIDAKYTIHTRISLIRLLFLFILKYAIIKYTTTTAITKIKEEKTTVMTNTKIMQKKKNL